MPNPDEDEAVAGTSLAYLPSGLKMPKPLNTEGNLEEIQTILGQLRNHLQNKQI